MSKFYNSPFILLFYLFLPLGALTAQSDEDWQMQRTVVRSFIENQGQFQIRSLSEHFSDVQYAYDGKFGKYLFSKEGLVVELTEKQKRIKTEEIKAARNAKKQAGFKDAAEYRAFEKEGHRIEIETDDIAMHWLGANTNVEIQVAHKDDFYHSYSFYDIEGTVVNQSAIPSYKKLTYKDLYDNIDVVYEIHPTSGFKYSIIVHPGGDISEVKLEYSKDIILQSDGTIHTSTQLGDVIDHAPVSFYADNQNNIIYSQYLISENVISFALANYDANKTIIIDPWTQIPNFTNTGWDCVWECERDAVGNVYVIGGTSPLQLIKYDAAGTQQWIYNTPYDTTEWLGTFAVDPAGNSYVSNGSAAKIFKVNTAAALVWNNNSPGGLFASTEFWNITFNCDMTRLVIGGTGGFLPPLPYIYDIDLNTGNVLASVQVSESSLFNVQEVRSITPTGNAKYYFLTHDSIGYIHQSLTACTQNGNDIFHVSSGINLGYKCENWRYNNAGIMAIAHYDDFIYVHRGNQLQKRDFATANIIATATIPAGVFNGGFGGNNVANSGIDIDDCGNIYVGSVNQVHRFDQSLALTGSFATSNNFNVYDVEVSTAGNIIAGGSTGTSSSGARTGYIQSLAVGACAQQAIICCDATICDFGPLCSNAAPVTIDRTTPGGTFTATCGTCINAVTGTFDPAVAGAGNHNITYTLACGSESIDVLVNTCTVMNVCEEANGDYTVAGGTAPYTWYEWTNGGTTPISGQTECTDCGCSWSLFFGCSCGSCVVPAGYIQYTTGTTVAPPSAFPAMVVNGNSDTFFISGPGILPSCGPLLAEGLLSFDAFPVIEGVNTKWAVENEQDMAYYEVQRSKDGIIWDAVGQLPSHDNSSSTQYYQLLDEMPYLGDSYYRLKQVDFMHQHYFSNVVSIFLNEDGTLVQVYPNPTRSKVTIDFGEIPTTEIRIRLFDVIGQEIPISNTNNGAQHVIDLSSLANGHYFLKIEMGENHILRKIEKY